MRNLHSMLRTDARRMFRQPLLYIMLFISFVVPILVLTMTTAFTSTSETGTTSSVTEAAAITAEVSDTVETTAEIETETTPEVEKRHSRRSSSTSSRRSSGNADTSNTSDTTNTLSTTTAELNFTNTWQMLGMPINLLFFMAAILVCIFVGDDFRSGYAKNLFTVRASKKSYVASKIIICSIASAALFLTFFVGTIIGGNIAQLPFAMEGFHALNIISSMLGKLFIIPLFVSIFVIAGTIAKKKLWLSISLSLVIGMLFFMIVPMMTGLTATLLNVIMCLAGGLLFSTAFGGVGSMILKQSDLV